MATDPKKSIKNSLFNPSVTGSTYEDFSQNAVLLPAMEKPIPAFTPEQVATSQQGASSSILTPLEVSPTEYFQEQAQTIDFTSPEEPPHPSSNFSSVLSSFSNYLSLGSSSNNPTETAPVPAVIEQPDYSQPVEFYTPSTQPSVPPPVPLASSSGPVNSYRRSTLKRPAYAQVPGLTTAPIPSAPPFESITSNYPQPYQPSISPASSSGSIQDATLSLNNQFKPINPQPPCFPTVKPSCPQPQQPSSQGPVMSAISADEILSSTGDTLTDNTNSIPDFPLGNVQAGKIYRPVYHHWFYKKSKDDKGIWTPFSMVDSLALEGAFTSNDLDPDKVLETDGGRYDVNILRRQRIPVYWEGEVSEVRRCSWFFKSHGDRRYVPYDENVATKLEEEYKFAFESNQWHRKVLLDNGESVEFYGPDVLVLVPPAPVADPWTGTPNQARPRVVVKRGMDEFDIDEGEPAKADHLLLMVHGIGSVCDLKFRTVEEVVDEFRNIALQLTQSHYKSSCERGVVHKIEVLPISWHGRLHSKETGVDEQLKKITLESIPKLREFTNDTILDVLFYTSPVYCQTIISTVGNELNRVYQLFKKRNPNFKGGVSIGGHSLGSLIIFDLLAHQHAEDVADEEEEAAAKSNSGDRTPPNERKICRRISYMMGNIGAGQPKIIYPHLEFEPKTFFALGSPIGMFVTVRGLDKLGDQFCLPTCPAFFNIFHPYDPVAYRIEALVNPDLAKLKPVLIPHHKGRKRMHLELAETVARVGADIKQKLYDSMKNTINSFYQLATFHRAVDQPALESEMSQSIQRQLESTPEVDEQLEAEPVVEKTDIPLGQLNKGRRIDYVLQEAPLEFINEYLFALTSHVCYWESEDTILMILKEVYTSMGVQTDSQIPQQTMTIERPPPSPKVQRQTPIGIDPTSPINQSINLPPPPTAGFVRKT